MRDPKNPDGHLLWGALLKLLYPVELSADNLPELVALARQHLEDSFPDRAPPLRVLIVPDKPPGALDSRDIAVVELSAFGGWKEDGDLRN